MVRFKKKLNFGKCKKIALANESSQKNDKEITKGISIVFPLLPHFVFLAMEKV